MLSPRRTRSATAALKSTDKAAMSVVVQTAPIEDADTDADDRDNLHNANDMDSDLELDNHMSPARIRNQEQEGEGGEETGTGSATTSVRGIQIEQMHPNDMAGLTTKIQHILDNVHQAWGIANINMLLDAAIRPSAWTERPAKQLSKLARATGVDQRAWAIGQLGQLARGRPLNKSIIQQVYDQAVAEGKLALGRSSQRSRAPASVPETPQAQKQQRRRRQQQQQQQTSTGSSQRGAPSANPTAGRAASIELGQSPPSNSRLQTAEAQGDDSESELIPDYNVRSLPIASHHQRNSRDLSSHLGLLYSTRRQAPTRNVARIETTSLPLDNPSSRLHHRHLDSHNVARRSNSNIIASPSANASTSQPLSSSHQAPPPTSSPNAFSVSAGASSHTTIDSHRTSSKRKFVDLIEEALKQREADLESFQKRLKTMEARRDELKYELAKTDTEVESAIRRISAIDAEVASQRNELFNMRALFSSIITSTEGGDPQSRRSLVKCEHQNEAPLVQASNTRDEIIVQGMDESLMDAVSLDEAEHNTTITPSGLAVNLCVPCLFVNWQTASQVEFRKRETYILNLEAKRAQAEMAQQEQAKQSSRLKELEIQEKDIEKLRDEIQEAEADISKVMTMRL